MVKVAGCRTEKFEGPSGPGAEVSPDKLMPHAKHAKTDASSAAPRALPNTLPQHASPLAAARALVAEGREDAFMVMDVAVLRAQAARWRKELPRVRPLYAVKCNPNPAVIQTLAGEGFGFDVASKTEHELVREYAAGSLRSLDEDVIYANPCKQPSHVRAVLAEGGVSLTTFDNVDELRKVHRLAPNARFVARILGDDSNSVCKFNAKFGADVDRDLPALLREAAAIGANVVGISFHVGSGCSSPMPFVGAVEAARRAFDMFEPCGLPKPYFLDLGGGWPGTLPGQTDKGFCAFEDIAAMLRPTLDRCFPESSGVTIVAEPGRYFVHAAMTLYTCVHARRAVYPEVPDLCAADSHDGSTHDANEGHDLHDSGDEATSVSIAPAPTPAPVSPVSPTHAGASPASSPAGARMLKGYRYYVNSGLYHEFNCMLYDHRDNVEPSRFLEPSGAVKQALGPLLDCSCWGPTCDSIDCIAKSCPLPQLDVGDWMEWSNMGAYTSAACTHFNGFAPADVYYINMAAKA